LAWHPSIATLLIAVVCQRGTITELKNAKSSTEDKTSALRKENTALENDHVKKMAEMELQLATSQKENAEAKEKNLTYETERKRDKPKPAEGTMKQPPKERGFFRKFWSANNRMNTDGHSAGVFWFLGVFHFNIALHV